MIDSGSTLQTPQKSRGVFSKIVQQTGQLDEARLTQLIEEDLL